MRWRVRGNPARPCICLMIRLVRVLTSSVRPLWYGRVSPASMAARSSSRPFAKECRWGLLGGAAPLDGACSSGCTDIEVEQAHVDGESGLAGMAGHEVRAVSDHTVQQGEENQGHHGYCDCGDTGRNPMDKRRDLGAARQVCRSGRGVGDSGDVPEQDAHANDCQCVLNQVGEIGNAETVYGGPAQFGAGQPGGG